MIGMRSLYPHVVATILIIGASLPLRTASSGLFTPEIGIIVVYYWTIFRPFTLNYWFLLILGIFHDAIIGLPLGIHSLIYIAMAASLLNYRERFLRHTFSGIWLRFSLWAVVIFTIQWLLISFSYERLMAIDLAFIQLITTILAYPLIHHLCMSVQRMLPQPTYEG